MADKGRSNFTVMGRGPDANWFGTGDIYEERPWYRSKASINEYFDITPTNVSTLAFGQETLIEIDKRGTRLGKIELLWDVAAISMSTAAYGAFTDWEGPSSIDYIEFTYNTKIFHKVFGEEILHDILIKDTRKNRSRKARLMYGKMSDVERSVLATSARTVQVDLAVPWSHFKKMLPMNSYPNKIVIKVVFKPFAKVYKNIVGASPTAPAITNLKARCQFHHLPHADANALWAKAHQGKGIVTKHTSTEFIRGENLVANQTTHTIKLKNLKNAAYEVRAFVVNQSDRDTQATLNPYNYILPTSHVFQDSGSDVTNTPADSGTQSYQVNVINAESHPDGELGLQAILHPFCHPDFVAKSDHDCYGSRNFVRTPFYIMQHNELLCLHTRLHCRTNCFSVRRHFMKLHRPQQLTLFSGP